MQFTTIAAILLTFGRCDVVVGTKDHIQISLLDATFKNPLSWLTVPEAVFLGLSLQILRTLPNPILENSRAWRCKRSGWGRRKGIRHTAHSPDGSEVSVALKPLPSSITKDASSRSNRKHSWLRTRLRSALQELGNLGCCSRFVSTKVRKPRHHATKWIRFQCGQRLSFKDLQMILQRKVKGIDQEAKASRSPDWRPANKSPYVDIYIYMQMGTIRGYSVHKPRNI